MASDDLTPLDRDALVRTVIGEAGNQGPEGMAAVAHSVMNRVVSGRYGNSPAEVVLAPGQYEPWQTRRQELLSYNPSSAGYQQAGRIVDAVVAGDVPDSTNGATHFLNPAVVMQRRGSLPSWAKSPTAKVGSHTFFAPEGKASASTALDAINDAIGTTASPEAVSALPFSDDSSSSGGVTSFRAAGFAVPGDKNNNPDKGPGSSPAGGSLLKAAGFQLPGTDQSTVPNQNSAWQDTEAQSNLAATTASYPAVAPAGPGRGIVQALKDTFNPANIAQGIWNLPQRAMEASARDVQSLGDAEKPRESVGPLTDAAMLFYGNKLTSMGARTAATAAAPSTQAINRLVDAIGPENVPAAVERLNANPRLAVADVSDPVRTMAQGLIDPAQPKAQLAISEAVKSRQQGATQATNDAYTTAMGPSPDVLKMVEGLKERARAAGREAIQPALENAKLVDTSPVIEAIDAKLQPGVNPLLNPKSELPLSAEQEELARFKQQLVSGSGEQLFDAQRLHRIQSDIGDKAYQLTQSADPKDRMLGGQLRTMNEKLIDQIDEASGGAYRPARQKFADAKDVQAAFESGFDTLKNRAGLSGALEDSPDALRAWVKEASPEEVRARQLGTRADIAQKINGVKNGALAGETITRIEYNKDKLRTLFGDTEANRLIRNMDDAADQRVTNNKLIAGAKTAETLAGQKALAVPKVTGVNPLQVALPIGAEIAAQSAGIGGVGLAASLAAQGAFMGAQKLGQMNALARNTEFAKAALATGQPRAALINKLMAHPKVVRAARQ